MQQADCAAGLTRLTAAAGPVRVGSLMQKCPYLFNPLNERDRVPYFLFQWREFPENAE
jgi:hypothetical protein